MSFISWQNTKAIALLYWPKHRSLSSVVQSTIKIWSQSISFISGANYQGYSLTYWPKLAHCHQLSIYYQTLMIVTFRHFGANYQGNSLTFWPKLAQFHHFWISNQNLITVNFGHLLAKCQGYSLTFWPNLADSHNFSICNQYRWNSPSVIFGQNTKAIALLFGQMWLIFITFQSAIKTVQIHFRSFLGQNTKAIALLFGQNSFIVITFQSAIKPRSNSISVIFGQTYQGYSLTFWPKLAQFHLFSIWNSNSDQSQFWSLCGQTTKAIALRFGQNSLIFITFQSAIKICQSQFRSFLGKIPRL